MAVSTIDDKATSQPVAKVKWGIIWGVGAACVMLFMAVPFANEFVLSPANRIDLSPGDYLRPFVPIAVGFAAAYIAKPHHSEGTKP